MTRENAARIVEGIAARVGGQWPDTALQAWTADIANLEHAEAAKEAARTFTDTYSGMGRPSWGVFKQAYADALRKHTHTDRGIERGRIELTADQSVDALIRHIDTLIKRADPTDDTSEATAELQRWCLFLGVGVKSSDHLVSTQSGMIPVPLGRARAHLTDYYGRLRG